MALNKPTGDMLNAGSDVSAQDLGTAAAGTSSSYSRADHVHKKPTAAEVGAVATSQLGVLNGVATLDGAGKLTSSQIPALTTSQIAQITPAVIGAVSTGDVIGITKGGTGAITAAAARTILGITPVNIGAMSTDERAGLATLTAGTLTSSQVAALTGDVTSTAGNPATTVVKIQSKAVSNATPGAGQVLTWDGSQWAPATSTGGGGGGANGLTYYLNYATAPDGPITGLPGTVKQLGRQGEVAQQSVTTAALAVNTWTYIAGFVSESAPVDPATTQIPAGLWDFNIWALGDANVAANTSIRAVAYVYNGIGLTLLGTSGGQVINGTSAQYSLSVLVQQTTVDLTDRIYIAIEAYATGNNHTVTAQFGDSTPSHVHTSLPLVGGTGLWKAKAGSLQSPATLLFDADVDPAAAIATSKIAGLAASATTDATNASNITSGTLSTARLADVSPALPTGAQGTATVIPSITVDSKGRVTALSTNTMASYVQTSALNTANGVATLDGNTRLTVGQMPGLTGDVASTAGTTATTLATIAGLPTLAQGSASAAPVVTVDTKGRVTSLTTATITPAAIGAVSTSDVISIAKGGTGSITAAAARTALGITPANIGAISTDQQSGFATLTAGTLTTSQMPALTGDVTNTAGTTATTLVTVAGLTPGSAGSTTTTPVITVDAKGRVTSLSSATIAGGSGSGTVTTTGTGLSGSMSKFSSETAITKAVAGTDYQLPLSSAAPLAISAGGTGANNALDGLTNLGNAIFPVTVRQVGNITPASFTATTMTFAVGAGIAGTAAIDGYTIAQGDSVCFVLQSVTNQSGPWVITTLGTASVGAVLTRPPWFTTGTAKSGTLCVIQTGTSNTGFILALSGPLNGTNAPIAIGTAIITVSTIWGRSTLATVSANTFTGTQTLPAGTLTSLPAKFSASSLLVTTALANGIEWDNQSLYLTNSSAIRKRVSYIEESVTNVAFPATPFALNVDIDAQEIVNFTSTATANFTVNVRGTSTVAFNSVVEINKSRSFVLLNTNATAAYAPSSVSVDGTAQTVKWVNGVSTGNVNSLDAWTFTIIKTAANTYTVLGSVAKYA